MSITEYLYVDEKRLDSYFEQISSPLYYEKTPMWKIAIGLTGPSVETTLGKQSRQFTRHEKITALMEYLEKNDLVETYRPADRERWNTRKVFRLETCRAIRVFIPPKKETSAFFPGLSLWISYAPHPKHRNPEEEGYSAGSLYLLEDFQGEDNEYVNSVSSYSALDMLLNSISTEEIESGRIKERPETAENKLSFSSHPDKFFESLGAKLGKARLIHTLYRIRATCNDRYSEPRFAVVTIGYPVFVAEE